MSDVVIIGGGQAGCMTAINLRKQKFEGGISIITDEAHHPYQRPPLSKGFLTGLSKQESLFFKSESYYEKNKIDVMLKSLVSSIDKKKQEVLLEDGRRIKYKKLVIATGSKLNKITSQEDKKIIYLNSISNALSLKQQLSENKSIGIVGAGYIGLEVAATALKMGLKTTVFEAEKRIMQRSASTEFANFINNYHEKMGAVFKLGAKVQTIEPQDEKVSVTLNDGYSASLDFVVIGVGVQAESHIAQEAEIEFKNGIVVDENCLTSDENIYAAGDCVSYYFSRYNTRHRLESVQNAIQQAAIVSSSIMGKPTPYSSIPWFWSDQYDLKIQIAGLSNGCDLAVIRGDKNECKFSVCHFKDNRLTALECVNDQKTFMLGKKLIEAGSNITPNAMENKQTNLKDWR